MEDFNNIKGTPQALMFEGAKTTTVPAVIQHYKYANDAGGYYVRGLWIAPWMYNNPYWWPWDLGVPGGNVKDENLGWNKWGYVYDGKNKNLTSGVGNFANNGKVVNGVYITIYSSTFNATDADGTQYLDFTASPVVITFKDGRFDDVTWTGYGKSEFEWSEDKRTITIYKVYNHRVCWFNWTDDTSINKCREMLRNLYADVSGLQQYTTAKTYTDPHAQECWDAYQGGEHVYHKNKTVLNCLAKYYGSVDENGVVIVDNATNTPVLPQLSEITDLSDYDTTTLKMSSKGADSDATTVEWLNQCFKNLYDNRPIESDAIANLISGGYYGSIKVTNTADNPLIVYVPLGMSQEHVDANYAISPYYEVLDSLLFDGTLGGSKVNHLKVIFKDRGLAHKCMTSVAMRTFQSLQVDNLEIEHQEADGTVVTPHEAGWGFAPVQLNATFEGSNVTIIKREWIDWSRLSNMPYCFDLAGSLVEVQSNGEECLFYSPNMGSPTNADGADNGICKWPFFKNPNGGSGGEWYGADHAFWRASKLVRFEPILNVRYWANPNMCYYMFNSAPNVEYIKLKGLNNFDWDFTDTVNLYLPKLNAECIKFMFENLEDQVGTPYDEANVDTSNVSTDYPDVYYDPINVRTSRSIDGLTIKCPGEWGGFGFSTHQGWTVVSACGGTKVDHWNLTMTTRSAVSGVALRAANNTNNVTNLKFKVSGLGQHDTLMVGGVGNLASQTNTYTEDGEYTIESIKGNWGFGLFNATPYADPVETTTTEGMSIDAAGTEITADGYELTDYIAVDSCTSIVWNNGEANGKCLIVEYDADKAVLDFWNPTATSRTITLTGGTSTKYIRVGIKSSLKSTTYVTDETNKKYLFKGDSVTTKTYVATGDAVTITLVGCDEYPNKVTDDLVASAAAKGWTTYVGGVLWGGG